jgi:hypothetical protein
VPEEEVPFAPLGSSVLHRKSGRVVLRGGIKPHAGESAMKKVRLQFLDEQDIDALASLPAHRPGGNPHDGDRK